MNNKLILLIFITTLLAACSSYRPQHAGNIHGARGSLKPGADYIIRRGDTLFSIAWRYGIDTDDLARWNGISDKNKILVGQRLRTTPPTGAQRVAVIAPTVSSMGQAGWVWPTRGSVVQTFSPNEPGKQGMRFRGSRGQSIHAAAAGEVAYKGTGLAAYGLMVMIRHNNGILSAYGYLDSASVNEGQRVSAGQPIGTMGIGAQNQPTLHFEIRQKGTAVNPYSYIGTTARYQ